MTTIILILTLALATVSFFYFKLFVKYNTLNKKITDALDNLKKPIRRGYFIRKLTLTTTDTKDNTVKNTHIFEPLVYVIELDRYTNGESKVEIERIETCIDASKTDPKKVENFIKDEFKSLMKTSDIIWLESEQSIKDLRKNKLEQLKANFK